MVYIAHFYKLNDTWAELLRMMVDDPAGGRRNSLIYFYKRRQVCDSLEGSQVPKQSFAANAMKMCQSAPQVSSQ